MARASESVNTHGPINSLRLVHRWSEAAPLGGAGVGDWGGTKRISGADLSRLRVKLSSVEI